MYDKQQVERDIEKERATPWEKVPDTYTLAFGCVLVVQAHCLVVVCRE